MTTFAKKIEFTLIFYPILIVFLWACNSTSPDIDLIELSYAETDKPTTIIPFQVSSLSEAQIVAQIHETLVVVNPETQEVEPRIAENWVVNSDNTRYLIYLKDSIFFHKDPIFGKNQTRNIVALDVVASIKNYIHYCKIHNKSLEFLSDIKGVDQFYDACSANYIPTIPIEGIMFSDDRTLVFELVNSSPLLLYDFAHISMAIMPHEVFNGSDSFKPIGCGPYFLDDLNIEDGRWTLLVNTRYNIDTTSRPFFHRINIYFDLSIDKELQMFSEGIIDFVQNIEKDYVNRFMEQNIDRFQKSNPDFIIKQREGQEESSLFFMYKSSFQEFSVDSFGIIHFNTLRWDNEAGSVN